MLKLGNMFFYSSNGRCWIPACSSACMRSFRNSFTGSWCLVDQSCPRSPFVDNFRFSRPPFQNQQIAVTSMRNRKPIRERGDWERQCAGSAQFTSCGGFVPYRLGRRQEEHADYRSGHRNLRRHDRPHIRRSSGTMNCRREKRLNTSSICLRTVRLQNLRLRTARARGEYHDVFGKSSVPGLVTICFQPALSVQASMSQLNLRISGGSTRE